MRIPRWLTPGATLYGIPAPGTTMGVGDEVQVVLETEFYGPPSKAAAQ
jgi:hypothetical protein